jgi:hypothetical protein
VIPGVISLEISAFINVDFGRYPKIIRMALVISVEEKIYKKILNIKILIRN